MRFEEKVEALVEKLVEDIAALASDGEEYENGMSYAVIILLDEGAAMLDGTFLDDDDDFDPFDDPLQEEDDSLWDSTVGDGLDDDDDDLFSRRRPEGFIQ